MFKIKLTIIVILFGGIVLGALSYLIPVPHLSGTLRALMDENEYHTTLSFTVVSVTYSLGGALLFLLGLKGFTKAFRRVYYSICAGLSIQVLGILYYAYATINGSVKTDIFLLVAEIPLIVGMIVVYIGFVKYARLLGINSLLTKLWLVALGFTLVMVVVWFLPHRTDGDARNELLFDLAHVLQAVELLLYLVVSTIIGQIRNSTSPLYGRSLMWFRWFCLTVFTATLVLFGQDYIRLYSWINTSAMSLLYILSNMFTTASAYDFNKIARLQVTQSTYNNSLLDSVIFLGSLASNVKDVDPILDEVRSITAQHVKDTPLTADETHRLQQVYKDLEDYLVTREQLRTFDRKGLGELIQERFSLPAA